METQRKAWSSLFNSMLLDKLESLESSLLREIVCFRIRVGAEVKALVGVGEVVVAVGVKVLLCYTSR